MLVSAGAVYGYVRWRLNSIRTIAAPHLTATSGSSGGALPVENILMIGNQTRAGLTNPKQIAQFGSPQLYSGSLSDVIMILHIDPAKHVASLLSIPRDLFLPMPPGSPVGAYQKIDAALNDGANGPDNLIQTITNDLGIPINHYIELNFNGFEKTVNAIGGINVDFPEPVFDAYSLLNIPTPGCQHLNGAQALALVRARHLQYDPPGTPSNNKAAWPYDPQSDLSRIVRDHTFLRILASTAESKGLTNPVRANAFIAAIINQITIDPGLRPQLISLVTHYRHLNPATVPETTLPVTQVGGSSGYYYHGVDIGDVDFPQQPADNATIAAWDSGALPAPVAPTNVAVTNITNVYHLAATTAVQLSAVGVPSVVAGNGTIPASITETLVRYHPGDLAQAMDVVDHLSGAIMLQAEPAVAAGSIALDVGTVVAVTHPPATASSAPAPTSGAGPTPGHQKPSPAADRIKPWDPRPCGAP